LIQRPDAYRFATVVYRGGPLPCRNPLVRGVFGIAVLTREPVTASQGAPYEAQLGAEERRWLCVETDDRTRACTSHLSVSGSAEQAATNQAQCEELSAVLAGGDLADATIFGGDVNRQGSCAPPRAWTERDDGATQARGIQHVYGSLPGFVRPRPTMIP
jgi:endonuclease/exonuclease/phosphatase family metal-dependent hydrolase